jgi:hypothetical protein
MPNAIVLDDNKSSIQDTETVPLAPGARCVLPYRHN